jgi:hypothetical protein
MTKKIRHFQNIDIVIFTFLFTFTDICELGSYFDKEDSMECKKCPVGFYQDKELELKCEPCLGNLTTREEGANNKDICECMYTTSSLYRIHIYHKIYYCSLNMYLVACIL